MNDLPQVLIPFDPREAMTITQAAELAGYSETTIKKWCALHFIGRRIVGGHWKVSVVALAMLIDNNEPALRAYLSGDRTGPLVVEYFERMKSGFLISHKTDGNKQNRHS